VLPLLGLHEAVGQVREGRQLLVDALLLVLLVDLELLIVGVEEVDREVRQVLQVVLARLGDPAVA
jgi:hypothetical protein